MPVQLSLDDLIDYTDWEREKWREQLRQQGNEVLKTSIGPHGDGRFSTVGDLVRHIFSAEKRYVERLLGRPLSDTSSVPVDNLEAVLKSAGSSLEETVKLTVFLTDLKHFDMLNKVLAERFPKDFPARSVVQVSALPKNASVEMDVIALKKTDKGGR